MKAETMGAVPSPPRVFISYSHDSEEHDERVLALAGRLRAEGVDANLDRYEFLPDSGWMHWMEEQVRAADFVLVVCTERYRRSFDETGEPKKWPGATRQGAIIPQAMYEKGGRIEKFVPVVMTKSDAGSIPKQLQRYQYFVLESEAGYKSLYRLLTGQHNAANRGIGDSREVRITPLSPLEPRVARGRRSTESSEQSSGAKATKVREEGTRVHPEDFAVLIGISKYAAPPDVPGAVLDAQALSEWLVRFDGGGLPPGNVSLIVRNELAASGYVATSGYIDRAFGILRAHIEPGRTRIGRRLYIYAAGRGCRSSREGGSVLLDVAATPTGAEYVEPRLYAEYFQKARSFDEIVIVEDVGVDGGQTSWESVIDWPSPDLMQGPAPAWFSVDTRNAIGQGFLTSALLEGLSGGANSQGMLTSEILAAFLKRRMRDFGDGRDAISVELTGVVPITRRMAPSVPDGPPEEERVAAHADMPATVDELGGRQPFAEVLGERIEQGWGECSKEVPSIGRNSGGFMVHLHGPWGSGKTSVLNFLRTYLEGEDSESPMGDDAEDALSKARHYAKERWVVVEFNAWQQQSVRPPWWTLITSVYTQSAEKLDPRAGRRLRLRWWLWRVRADLLPILIACALFVITGVITFAAFHQVMTGGNAKDKAPLEAIDLFFKIALAVSMAGAGVFAFSRSLAFGSTRAAQAYMEMRTDPLRPIVRLFNRLVETVGRPVAVFIDDLDRCESKYVVELLEGIQTLFRQAHVAYVVAGDRKWVCSSFEKVYTDFAATIGEPGRPLGYFFLDKLFQVSVSVPRIPSEVQGRYWRELLRAGSGGDPKMQEAARRDAETYAAKEVEGDSTQEELDEKVERAKGDPIREWAIRAAAARQIVTPDAQRRTAHRLQRFAGLLEPNPRAMKRLLNAYGIHQATSYLVDRKVSQEILARWTIIELRWPLLAELLEVHPQLASILAKGEVPRDERVSENLKRLFSDDDLLAVVRGKDDGMGPIIDENAVRLLMGLPPRPTPPISDPPTNAPDMAKAADPVGN
jgi:hypothetical protein